MSNSKQKFKGRWKLYLNAPTPEELAAKNEFYGDWTYRKKDIFSRRRKFKAVIYPVTSNGTRLHELVIEFKNTGTLSDLSQQIFRHAMQYFEEWLEAVPDIDIDTNQCYAVVRA